MVSQLHIRGMHSSWAGIQTSIERMNAREKDRTERTRHVLVVEDSLHDIEMVRYALLNDPQHRYVFSEAGTLALARELLISSIEFDIVILDWRLPDGLASSLIGLLSNGHDIPRVPIVLLTSSDEHLIDAELLKSGVQDYFTKECLLPGILPRIVSNAIDRYRLLSELAAQRRTAFEAQTKAEEASRAKSAFLTGMSHELRTPLTAIVGLADLMLDDPANVDAPQMLEMIRNNGQHLTQLLGDLLDLAKIEIGRTTVTKTPCSIVAVTRELCNLMRHRANDEGLDLQLLIEPGFERVVSTDPVRFRQILLNLISNSVKYTMEGGIDITLRSAADPSFFEVEVRDTGQGIAPELQAKLFSPFVQGDSHRTGVGLGLSISRSLARALGGTLEFVKPNGEAKKENTGSVFLLRLPCGTSEKLNIAATELLGECAVSSPPLDSWSNRNILIVEDTRANQFLLRRMLEPFAPQIQIVSDGREALAAIEKAPAPFDLVLMDMQMPNLDGYDATSILRARGYPGLIIAITAAAMAGDAQKCLDVGCNDYVTKPFHRRSLLIKLDKFLQNNSPQ